MTQQTTGFWYFLVGAGFIGFWLYVGLFTGASEDWMLWGLLGIAIAAAFYAGRVSNENVRIGIWLVTGLFLGLLTAAAIYEQRAVVVATFITGVGAGLIAAGLPAGRHDAPSSAASPARPATPPYGQPPASPPPSSYETAPQTQGWQPTQQQQQGVRVYGHEYR